MFIWTACFRVMFAKMTQYPIRNFGNPAYRPSAWHSRPSSLNNSLKPKKHLRTCSVGLSRLSVPPEAPSTCHLSGFMSLMYAGPQSFTSITNSPSVCDHTRKSVRLVVAFGSNQTRQSLSGFRASRSKLKTRFSPVLASWVAPSVSGIISAIQSCLILHSQSPAIQTVESLHSRLLERSLIFLGNISRSLEELRL